MVPQLSRSLAQARAALQQVQAQAGAALLLLPGSAAASHPQECGQSPAGPLTVAALDVRPDLLTVRACPADEFDNRCRTELPFEFAVWQLQEGGRPPLRARLRPAVCFALSAYWHPATVLLTCFGYQHTNMMPRTRSSARSAPWRCCPWMARWRQTQCSLTPPSHQQQPPAPPRAVAPAWQLRYTA